MVKNMNFEQLWSEIRKENFFSELLDVFDQKVKQERVVNYISAHQRIENSEYTLKHQPVSLSEIKKELFSYMENSVNTQSPYFVNQLYGGAHPVAVLSEFINAFMNTSMATYEIAPIASLMENELIFALGELSGWSKTDGIMVPGGSYANMMAMHLARFEKNSLSKIEGHDSRLVIYISDQAHYSIKKAAHLLGFGEKNVQVIGSNKNHQMDVLQLKKQMQQDLEDKKIPCLVVSTLGTTVFGAIDPILEIQKICEEYKAWHHVDGAWGGPLAFSSEVVKSALKNVDSITYDFHKLLGGTLTKAIFITQKENLLSQANSCAGTQYIFHEDEDSFFDTGTKAIQCGRKVDSMPLWMTWKYLGTAGFKAYVDDLMELRQVVKNQIAHYNYELLHEPEYLNICFKVRPHRLVEDMDHFQRDLRTRLIKAGEVYVNYSSSKDEGVFIRLVLNHLRLTEEVIVNIFKKIDLAVKEN